MFKFIVTCTLALLSSNVLSNPVRSVGVGSTEDAARRHAFQRAIEAKVGTLILSETVVRNDSLVKDEIFDFSSGYVDKFKVISVEQRGRQYIVEADVWVADSKLKNRIITKNRTDSAVDGVALGERIESYQQTKQQGDRLVAKAVEYYPSRSFDVQLKNSDFKIDSNRQPYFIAQVSVTWSEGFIKSLHEVLARTQDGDKSTASSTVMIASAPNDDNIFKPNARKSYYFNDQSSLQLLQKTFERKSPMLVVSFNRSGQNIHSACVRLPLDRFYGQASIDDLRVKTFQKDLISVTVPLYNVDVRSISDVKLSIIGKDQC
jgi:hypothetical protein